MAFTRFNGATVTLTNAAGTDILTAAGITSFNYQGGTRSEIDITQSTSTSKEVIAGFRDPRRVSLGLKLDQATIAELDGMIGECGSGVLSVSFGVDCGAPAQLMSLSVFLMNYTVDGNIDEALMVTCDFMVDERPIETGP